MGDPKWEELPFDCLVDIFERVGWVSLVEGVPFVCKSWYKVSLSPLCWQSLIFADDFPGPCPLESSFMTYQSHSLESFIKFVIRRSGGLANVIAFPDDFSITPEVLRCIGEGCPSLKRLVLGDEFYCDGLNAMLSSMIHKWSNLEALEINSSGYLLNCILPEISACCKNFVSLTAIDVKFDESEAHDIVTLLPNLKFLSFKESRIERSNAVIILKGCKNLVHFDVGIDFDVDDEILNLAAHIPTFKFKVFKFKVKDSESSDEAWNYGVYSSDNERNNYSSDDGYYASGWEYDAGLSD